MNSGDNQYPVSVQKLLYEDGHGRVVGLDEVQLLDPIPIERIPLLRVMLGDQDTRIVFEAASVLAAWGDEVGIKKVEEMIDGRSDSCGAVVPQRIAGYNNVYDELAQVVRRYGLSGGDDTTRKRIYRKLLNLYGPLQFESKLKHALLRDERIKDELYPDVIAAIERSLCLGKVYLASQLLPVAAKWRPNDAFQFVNRFAACDRQIPDPAANIAEALKYVPSVKSRSMLLALTKHSDRAVAEEAKKSLTSLKSMP